MNKKELLKKYEEKIGTNYFELLQFASIINLCREELTFNDKIEKSLDNVMTEIEKEANNILEEEVKE